MFHGTHAFENPLEDTGGCRVKLVAAWVLDLLDGAFLKGFLLIVLLGVVLGVEVVLVKEVGLEGDGSVDTRE